MRKDTYYANPDKEMFRCPKCHQFFHKDDELIIRVTQEIVHVTGVIIGEAYFKLPFWFQHLQCPKEKE